MVTVRLDRLFSHWFLVLLADKAVWDAMLVSVDDEEAVLEAAVSVGVLQKGKRLAHSIRGLSKKVCRRCARRCQAGNAHERGQLAIPASPRISAGSAAPNCSKGGCLREMLEFLSCTVSCKN